MGPALNCSDRVDALNYLRAAMKGYWIDSRGVLRVEFSKPPRWQRFVSWFYGRRWVDYEH